MIKLINLRHSLRFCRVLIFCAEPRQEGFSGEGSEERFWPPNRIEGGGAFRGELQVFSVVSFFFPFFFSPSMCRSTKEDTDSPENPGRVGMMFL